MNLLKETIEFLEENGKTIDDITYIVGNDFGISKDDFIRLANYNYDDGYGSPEVATDLKLCGNGFWIERHEYDGSEWWEFKEQPKPLDIKSVTRLS